MRYEYQNFNLAESVKNMDDLNKLGDDGWLLCDRYTREGAEHLIFVREKPPVDLTSTIEI